MADLASPIPAAPTAAPPAAHPRTARREWLLLVGVLLLALVQGVLYLVLLPPWQHYDEPSHFEYAWLAGNGGYSFAEGDILRNQEANAARRALRIQIRDSMIAHGFYRDIGLPDLESGRVWIGFPTYHHEPTYYALVGSVLRLAVEQGLVAEDDRTTQLYLARSVSLLLFLLTIGVAIGIVRDLTPPGHVLRWAVPLALVLLPPFVDVMTSVNSDVLAALAGAFWLWGVVRLLQTCARRPGLSPWHLVYGVWVLAASGCVVAAKNTAAVLIVLLPLVLLVALWLWRGWRWRWLVLLVLVGAGAGGVALLTTGDAAAWYRWKGAATQSAPLRVAHADAPHGQYVLQLTAESERDRLQERRILQPLLKGRVRQVAGETITVGGWLWATQPVDVGGIGVAATSRVADAFLEVAQQPLTLDTTPRFVAWTFAVPADTAALHYVLSIAPPARSAEQTGGNPGEPLRVYLDGAVLAVGDYPTDAPPTFAAQPGAAPTAGGTWGGQPFTNLLRNGSAEQPWLRVRPWLESGPLSGVAIGWGRTFSLLAASLQDVERSREIAARFVGFLPLDGLYTGLAWGHIRLTQPPLLWLFRVLTGAALAGCGWWVLRRLWQQRQSRPAPEHNRALLPIGAVLLAALLLVWGNTILRAFPKISEGLVYPSTRYTFPVMVATVLVLVGGWWALFPARLQRIAVLLLLVGLAALNAASVALVWWFYRG